MRIKWVLYFNTVPKIYNAELSGENNIFLKLFIIFKSNQNESEKPVYRY